METLVVLATVGVLREMFWGENSKTQQGEGREEQKGEGGARGVHFRFSYLLLLQSLCRPVLSSACRVEDLASHDWRWYITRDLNKCVAQQQQQQRQARSSQENQQRRRREALS